MTHNTIKEFEENIRNFWEEEGIYSFNPNSNKKIYSVDTPPPTLSGRMHIGHASSYSQQDFIIRYKRMKGFEVFYPFGTDDNGLPTERLVEKNKGVKSKEMSRPDFIKLCLEFVKDEIPLFVQDWKNIGISCDWNNIYSTIDDESRKISQWSFLDLYEKGRLERKDSPAMWCPECQTGVAQFELQDKELDSSFNDLVFEIEGEKVIIATTRPELLSACVAIFYNPEDKRFKKYHGKTAKVPLFNLEVPILDDKRVDPQKGSGLVMCCTFGDQTDMEWQKAYNLPIKMAISENGKMTKLSEKYEGMKIKEARKEIIKDLREAGFLIKQEPIKHIVNVHERCGKEIEFVKSKQWFVRYLDLKDEMIKWGRELKWHPEFMRHRYENWVKGLQWDWLISNQRHFGVSFPVWYCKKCNEILVAEKNQLPVDPLVDKPVQPCGCGSKEFVPETDILNTWFTSSLTPQIAINLVKDEKTRKKVFPMNLRPQAHDIISFWLFNTVVKSRLHFKKNPWEETIISGFVTLKGEKMSKSKGNIVAPQDIIEKYGVDSMRYWAASSKLGEDFDYNEKDVVTGKRLVTKLLNASRFVFMNLENYIPRKVSLMPTDKLFLNELNLLIKNVTNDFEKYDYHKVRLAVDNFFWNIFCDNYLEIVKKRVYSGNKDEKESAFYCLYLGLLSILKMFAPIMPYVTEKIYQDYFRKNEKEKSIHISSWPGKVNVDGKVNEEIFNVLLETIFKIRKEKSSNKKSMNSEIVLTLEKKDYALLEPVLLDLKNVTNSKEIVKGSKFSIDFLD